METFKISRGKMNFKETIPPYPDPLLHQEEKKKKKNLYRIIKKLFWNKEISITYLLFPFHLRLKKHIPILQKRKLSQRVSEKQQIKLSLPNLHFFSFYITLGYLKNSSLIFMRLIFLSWPSFSDDVCGSVNKDEGMFSIILDL